MCILDGYTHYIDSLEIRILISFIRINSILSISLLQKCTVILYKLTNVIDAFWKAMVNVRQPCFFSSIFAINN